jgi:parallel beta-helix repeat protein
MMFELLVLRRAVQRHILPKLLILLGVLALGIPSGAALPTYAQPSVARAPASEGDHTPGQPAAWDVVGDSVIAPNLAGARVAVATDCLGLPARRIRYTSDGVLHLEGCGQIFTLSDIPAAGFGADKLELVDPANKIWFLKIKLKVEEGATLRVIGGAAGDANWLRLRSDSAGGIWLRAENGNLLFQDTKVTSWDAAYGAPDTDLAVAPNGSGGRSYIAARTVLTKGRSTAAATACDVGGGSQEPYESRMNVINSEIGYLGYDAAESYGIAWKVYYKVNAADPGDAPPPGRQLYALADVFGDATGSTFHHNYFGSYTFGAYCMRWIGNTFANNIQYGLDPHDDSDFLTISGNTFRDNGNHGLICSVECDHLVITNNQSYGNQHGIMVHRNSNDARIEGNTSRDNRGAGIAIFDSHDALVRNNTVANNGEAAIRLSVGSSRNLIENNNLTGLAANGIGAGYVLSTYKGNDLPTLGDGLPKDNTFRGNRLVGYKNPILNIDATIGSTFENNNILGPATDMAFSMATGNIIRNSELGQTFQIVLDSTSMVGLQDTRNAIWLLSRAGLGTNVTAMGSTLSLTSVNAGPRVTVTTIDLKVKPQTGAITVLPSAWSADAHSWSETFSGVTGIVSRTVGGLAARSCYTVDANGMLLGSFKADTRGYIAISASGQSSTVNFTIHPSQCSVAAPAPAVRLPLIQR